MKALPLLGKIVTGAAKARTIMLAYYAGIASGLLMAVAWAATLRFAPEIAIDMLMKAKGLQ